MLKGAVSSMRAKRVEQRAHEWLIAVRRYFVAGLFIVLPTFLTVYILWFLFSLAAALIMPFVTPVLRLFAARETVELLATPVTLLIAAVVICLVGATGAAFSRRIFERTEEAFAQIPVVRGIQQTVRQVINMFFGRDTSFKQVALIEYPRRGLHTICFVTNPELWQLPGAEEPAVAVFVPTTPNPTSGFFLLVPKDQVRMLDISVDEAIKVIISGGIVSPPARHLPQRRPAEETHG
ncbi:MAG TPA: DUF502 domain-containing protein [Candidatus Binatia bacterium]|nr:DUF502 domain-containing protein [Candidatus Binatia bacterium]